MRKRIKLQKHERWWSEHLKDRMDWFTGKLGPPESRDRRDFRAFLRANDFASLLDCGGGPGIEYDGIVADRIAIDYTLMDVTKDFVDAAKARGIDAMHGRIQEIPAEDSSYDVVYARHVFDHLPSMEPALSEMIRVARKIVYISFSQTPGGAASRILRPGGFYLTKYRRVDVANHVASHAGVKDYNFGKQVLVAYLV